MKELRNSFDEDIHFDNLEKAKFYYKDSNSLSVEDEEDYLGDDFKKYVADCEEYQKKIQDADTLEELADALNEYSDVLDNGSRYFVEELFC